MPQMYEFPRFWQLLYQKKKVRCRKAIDCPQDFGIESSGQTL